eukprot:COSAG05_NODE_19339_length_294_cov_0.794872_1_plen_36_part_10
MVLRTLKYGDTLTCIRPPLAYTRRRAGPQVPSTRVY